MDKTIRTVELTFLEAMALRTAVRFSKMFNTMANNDPELNNAYEKLMAVDHGLTGEQIDEMKEKHFAVLGAKT